jgi:hypothetical protein
MKLTRCALIISILMGISAVSGCVTVVGVGAALTTASVAVAEAQEALEQLKKFKESRQ